MFAITDRKVKIIFFNLTVKNVHGKYVNQPLEVLKQNLLHLVRSAAEGPSDEVRHDNVPLLDEKKLSTGFETMNFISEKKFVLYLVSKNWYNVQYDSDLEVYVYNMKEDYKKGDIQIII
ncbi:hypothetical protein KUTeg_018641 [Tegillarca granosa]|uniref:Uncharacterized protein n=1 Tax=Tegillarca granosa TaxID=220873 RepID=A0ABQ9EKE2_TEGGR|nr:hypothetical protein KUTeg_018641 [Tegillarca granosa]